MARIFFIGTTLLFLFGCSTANISSYADRDALRGAKLSHVVVVASNFPLGDRQVVENAVVQEFRLQGVLATPGIDIMPPTRNLSDAEAQTAMLQKGVNTVLILFEKGRSTVETYVPPSIISNGYSTTTGSVTGYGNLYMNTTYSAPTVTGGYTVSKPTANYGAALYDLSRSGLQLWTAEINSQGSAFNSYEDLARDAGHATFQRLAEDGVTFEQSL